VASGHHRGHLDDGHRGEHCRDHRLGRAGRAALARFVAGPLFARLLPVSALLGAGYLLVVDDIARGATAADLPLGILTALVGAPFFVVLLARAGRQWL
jgi:hypothetical protein